MFVAIQQQRYDNPKWQYRCRFYDESWAAKFDPVEPTMIHCEFGLLPNHDKHVLVCTCIKMKT